MFNTKPEMLTFFNLKQVTVWKALNKNDIASFVKDWDWGIYLFFIRNFKELVQFMTIKFIETNCGNLAVRL